MDDLRLPAETGHPRQHREASDEGHRPASSRPSRTIASVRYRGYLTAGGRTLAGIPRPACSALKRKPVLFVMMNDTDEADDVADWLREKYPAEFGGEKTLVIHTDKSGEVSKKDLDEARKAVRDVDEPESPINAIVSVLMLREGWDVQERDGGGRAAPVHRQGEHPARTDHRARLAPDVPRRARGLHGARGHHRQPEVPRIRGRLGKAGGLAARHLRGRQGQGRQSSPSCRWRTARNTTSVCPC